MPTSGCSGPPWWPGGKSDERVTARAEAVSSVRTGTPSRSLPRVASRILPGSVASTNWTRGSMSAEKRTGLCMGRSPLVGAADRTSQTDASQQFHCAGPSRSLSEHARDHVDTVHGQDTAKITTNEPAASGIMSVEESVDRSQESPWNAPALDGGQAKLLNADFLATAAHDGTFDHGGELADVARPAVTPQPVLGIPRQSPSP